MTEAEECGNSQPLNESHTAPHSKISRYWDVGSSLIAGVLVALFIQKSDGNSSVSTVLYLALGAGGALSILGGVIAIRFRKYVIRHAASWYLSRPAFYLPGMLGGFLLLLLAFSGIDARGSEFVTPAGRNEIAADSDSIAIRNIAVADSNDFTRVIITMINVSEAPLVVDEAEFRAEIDGPVECAGNFPIYRLDDTVEIRRGDLRDMQLSAEGGPLSGYEITATGRLILFCADTDLSVRFPVQVSLGAQETTNLAVDIPHSFDATLEDMILYSGTRDEYPIGAEERVTIPLNIVTPEPGFRTAVAARVRHSSQSSWACIYGGIVNASASNEQLQGFCDSD